MDKKKLAKEVCNAISTGDIAIKVFKLINKFDGWPPSITKKGSVFMIKFDGETEIFDDKEFIKHIQGLVENIYDQEEIYEVGDVFDEESGFNKEVHKLLKIT
jgi:hypothetical protein